MNWIPLRLLWLLEHLGPNKSLCQIWIMMVIPRCSQGLKNHLSCGERYSNIPAFYFFIVIVIKLNCHCHWTIVAQVAADEPAFNNFGTYKMFRSFHFWIVMKNCWPGCGRWASTDGELSLWRILRRPAWAHRAAGASPDTSFSRIKTPVWYISTFLKTCMSDIR